MGMQINDSEQKLFFKLVREELRSYGINEDGENVGGKISKNDIAFVNFLLLTMSRIKKSVVREHKRSERIKNTLGRINQDLIKED